MLLYTNQKTFVDKNLHNDMPTELSTSALLTSLPFLVLVPLYQPPHPFTTSLHPQDLPQDSYINKLHNHHYPVSPHEVVGQGPHNTKPNSTLCNHLPHTSKHATRVAVEADKWEADAVVAVASAIVEITNKVALLKSLE